MLFESANQGLIFLYILLFCLILTLLNIPLKILKTKLTKPWLIIIDFCCSFIITILFYVICILFCYGQIRLYAILTYLFGLLMFNFLLDKIIQIIKEKLSTKKKKECWNTLFLFPLLFFKNYFIFCLKILW